MKRSYIFCFLLSFITAHTQILNKTAIEIGYRYSGRNVLQAGLEFKVNNKNNSSIITGASILYTSVNQQNRFLPELNIYYSRLALYGILVNPYAIEPKIGISTFNLMFINLGYSIPIHKEKYFKGITFGLQFNLAPSNTEFYDKMKLF